MNEFISKYLFATTKILEIVNPHFCKKLGAHMRYCKFPVEKLTTYLCWYFAYQKKLGVGFVELGTSLRMISHCDNVTG